MIAIYSSKTKDFERRLKGLLKGATVSDLKLIRQVRRILAAVEKEGDRALCRFIERFEGRKVKSQNFRLRQNERKELFSQCPPEVKESLKRSAQAIRRYHEEQIKHTDRDFHLKNVAGTYLEQRVRPLERVALYVPGGKANYPSSVLMNGVPARVAGVKDVVLVTPNASPEVVFAAKLLDIEEIYVMGGAQAIAGVAFGTRTIPKVDKIVGPGNVYVALAKKEVFGRVSIEMVAGPSEVLVIADETANPEWVAWDLLAQAEHDEMARPLCIVYSMKMAKAISRQVEKALVLMPKKAIAKKAIAKRGAIFVVKGQSEAIDIANRIAPEHLELQVENTNAYLDEIHYYGAAFLGGYSPEALGDYMAGPSHVLPTSGSARFASPLGVGDFLKKTHVLSYSQDALKEVRGDIETLANAEELFAHAKSVSVRFEKKD